MRREAIQILARAPMNVHPAVKSPVSLVCVLAAVCCLPAIAAGQAPHDVIFTTPFEERPTTAQFYYNKRAIGEGRQAFEDLLKQIRALPEGASIVWGPNYANCGACSGREP